MNACCTGCGRSGVPSPAIVTIFFPVARDTGREHERTARLSTSTVQAPHCPSPHPKRGLLSSSVSRRTYNSGQSGSTSTVWDEPLTVSVVRAISANYTTVRCAGLRAATRMKNARIAAMKAATAVSLVIGLSICVVLPLQAQWVRYPTAGVPRTKTGAVDLGAPAPRAADGKPDLSGIWKPEDNRACLPAA